MPFLRRLVSGAGALGLAMPFAAAGSIASAQPGLLVTFPYPGWFILSADRKQDAILFRKFGYEGGLARNLFVLTCNRTGPIVVEAIPPKGFETEFRKRASHRLNPSNIEIANQDNSEKFVVAGTYDRIASFFEIRTDDELFAFLDITSRERVLLNVQKPKLQYGLRGADTTKAIFQEAFPVLFDRAKAEEMSWQDAYTACGRFREGGPAPKLTTAPAKPDEAAGSTGIG